MPATEVNQAVFFAFNAKERCEVALMYMTRLELLKQFSENLERERISLGLSQMQMAEKLELSLSTYKRIATNSTEKVDVYVLYKLYLLTGKLAYEFTNLSNPYLDLKKKIRNMSPSQISFIDSLVDFENAFAGSHEDAEEYVTVYIPTGNMEDGMVYDSTNVTKVKIPDYRQKYGSRISCGIQITSNHLHPVYNRGDILLIAKSPVRDGDTGVFINKENGCAYIRKFFQTSPCRMEPVNQYGETFYVDSANKAEMEKWIKFGFVIAKVR